MSEIKMDLSNLIKQVGGLEERIQRLLQATPNLSRAILNVGQSIATADNMLTEKGKKEAGGITQIYGPTGQVASTVQTAQSNNHITQDLLTGNTKVMGELTTVVKSLATIMRDTNQQQKLQQYTKVDGQQSRPFGVSPAGTFGPHGAPPPALPTPPKPVGGDSKMEQLLEIMTGKAPSLKKMSIVGGIYQALETAGDLAVGARSAYLGGKIALGQATYRAPLERQIAEGALAGKEFEYSLGRMDATSAENMIKYRADLLMPGKKFKYLGTEGRTAALADAGAIQGKQLEIERMQAEQASTNFGWNAIKNIASSALTAGAIGAMGGSIIPGLGTSAGAIGGGLFGLGKGIADVFSSSSSFIGGQAENRAVVMDGGLNKGLLGTVARSLYGSSWDGISAEKRAAVEIELRKGRQDIADRIIQAEEEKTKNIRVGLQGQIDMISAQKEGALLVGGKAFTRRGMESVLVGSKDIDIGPPPPSNVSEARRFGYRNAMFGDRSVSDVADPATKAANFPKDSEQVVIEKDVTKMLDSITGRLEMSPAEFISKQNQLTNALGVGRTASLGATEKMIRLGRSGLGSFDQHLGALTQIERISGGQDNTRKLDDILASAVSIGFDKSRLAQSFVTTTTSIAQSIGTSNVEGVGQSLSLRAKVLGGGVADERTLAEAAKGMKDLDQATKGLQGVQGATKLAAIFGTGARVGTGAGTLAGLSSTQSFQLLKEIDEANGDPSKITSLDGKRLLLQNNNDLSKVKKMVEETYKGTNAAAYGIMNRPIAGSGTTFQKKLEEIKGLGSEKEKQKAMQKLMAESYDVGAASPGVGGNAAMEMIAQEAERAGVLARPGNARKMYQDAIGAGNAKFGDTATQNLRRYIDGLIKKSRETQNVSIDEYVGYLDNKVGAKIDPLALEGGNFSKEYGKMLTKENIQKARANQNKGGKEGEEAREFLQQAEKRLKGAGFDIARSAQLNADPEVNGQKVFITNFDDMARAFKNKTPEIVVGTKTDVLGGPKGIGP